MKEFYQKPNLERRTFAKTNIVTIAQRIRLVQEFSPDVKTIGEICCGDCSLQFQEYKNKLGIQYYLGLDLVPDIVNENKRRGINCLCGDALDKNLLKSFVELDLVFFGPPLSVECDAHRLLSFKEVTPGYAEFMNRFVGELNYSGTLVCICPKTTTMGDIQHLYNHLKSLKPDFSLRLIHKSHSRLTGSGEKTELRLKYIELWFSTFLEDLWEVKETE